MAVDLHLVRLTPLTQGVLIHNGRAFAVTLELPLGATGASQACIPAGIYTCQRVKSPKFGNTFEVTNVPGRTHILFHKGNKTADTLGCILVAEKFAGETIGESLEGYTEFMQLFKDRDSFTLEITDPNKL